MQNTHFFFPLIDTPEKASKVISDLFILFLVIGLIQVFFGYNAQSVVAGVYGVGIMVLALLLKQFKKPLVAGFIFVLAFAMTLYVIYSMVNGAKGSFIPGLILLYASARAWQAAKVCSK